MTCTAQITILLVTRSPVIPQKREFKIGSQEGDRAATNQIVDVASHETSPPVSNFARLAETSLLELKQFEPSESDKFVRNKFWDVEVDRRSVLG